MWSIDPERPSSAGRCGGENRQLGFESTAEGRPAFAAGYIGGEVETFAQYVRSVQAAQHGHHQKVTGAARTIIACFPSGTQRCAICAGRPPTCSIREAAAIIPADIHRNS